MFRAFAAFLPRRGRDLVLFHPADLIALLELAWDESRARQDNAQPLGHPFRRSDVLGFRTTWFGNGALNPAVNPIPDPAAGRPDLEVVVNAILNANCPILSDHLIYAYMIENTRIYEIFRRVVHEFLHGEKLGVPGLANLSETHQWLRSTEELFYRDGASFFVPAITSWVRPDLQSTRRNAYQRMFGMDLNHGAEDNKPYPYMKADAANSEFVSTFEEFLREVWIGIENVRNQTGANPTDDAKIADLAEKLFDMFRSRRQNGNLSREEFVIVSMMSWFHLTVEEDLPVIEDLRAQAATEEQRLFKVAQRVGLPAHGLSRSYFEIADPMSRILTQIEIGTFNDPEAVPALYTPTPGGQEEDMKTIITQWTAITGRDVKARKVAAN